MMCECDEAFGREFLPHQLDFGSELDTQREIPVTLGFQIGICDQCRGLPVQAFPRAAMYGATSKFKRYYWREIAFKTIPLIENWKRELKDEWTSTAWQETYNKLEREVVEELKQFYLKHPKYSYSEKSQAQVVKEFGVEVVELEASVVPTNGTSRRLMVADENDACTVETFAARHFERMGYESLFLESAPFHVLFGVYMWFLIQDPADRSGRLVTFGNRFAFEQKGSASSITTFLPSDFGTVGYSIRRTEAITQYFKKTLDDTSGLQWMFDDWLNHSYDFRQYLWAHQDVHITKARQLVEILPAKIIIAILQYLVGAYWHRYLGWPDLLLFRGTEYFFAEVKFSKDRLSEDQKKWIADNAEHLHLPFKLVKIHRTS
jgi:hypothetical protein